MAAGATIRTIDVELSDVDRGVYESFELRVAQHPSESLRYLWSRILAYCLAYDEDIVFSKGGLSTTDEPPVAIRTPDGRLQAWIDVGAPSAERLHKASKAAERVLLFSCVGLHLLRKEAGRRKVHQIEQIELWPLPVVLLDELAARTGRSMTLELVRTEGQLYVTVDGEVSEAEIAMQRLMAVD